MSENSNRVCIIDDDRIYRFTIDRYLKMHEISDQVIEFSDAEDALNFLESNVNNEAILPDVIFLDVNMPIIDGWQFLLNYQKFSKDFSKPIRIYMFSSSIDTRDKDRAKDFPEISDFIVKPISEQKLKELFN